MNHLLAQWRSLVREGIAARNGLSVEVDYVGGGKENIFGHTNFQGVIRSGTGYRAFGSWGEFKDSIKGGRWRSKAGFTIPGEGETQFATSLEALLKWESPASYVGTVGIIEADLSGCKMRTFIHTVIYGPEGAGGLARPYGGETDAYLWLPHEGAREGTLYVTNPGLGVGVDGGVPLDQVIRVHEVEKRQIVRSWPFREWPDHIDRVKDPKPPPPPPSPIDIVWWATRDQVLPPGNPLFHDMVQYDRLTACKLDIRKIGDGYYYEYEGRAGTQHGQAIMPEIAKAKSGSLQLWTGFQNAPTVQAKPCPKCWKSL